MDTTQGSESWSVGCWSITNDMDTIQKQEREPSEAQWSQFFKELLPTREVDSSIDVDRICVVAVHYSKHSEPSYFLYNAGLSSASEDNDHTIQSLKPILQFYCLYGDLVYTNYAVVGSKLFLVGGLNTECGWGSTFHYYDFGSLMYSDTTTEIEEGDPEAGPLMQGIKYLPIVAVVGGSKICVFSTLLYELDHSKTVHPPNFEVYNTEDQRWTTLCELANYGECGLEEIRVWSYCVERSSIVICTDIGVYGINISDMDSDPSWVTLEGSEMKNWNPFNGRWAVVGKNFCSPFEVARWGESRSRRLLSLKNRDDLTPDDKWGALCSERAGNDVVLCSVRGKTMPENEHAIVPKPIYVPVLMVDVVKFNGKLLDDSRGDVWETVRSHKSFSFVINSETCLCVELVHCFFPFKVTGKIKDEEGAMEDEIKDGIDALEDERRSKRPRSSQTG